jgi:hypothetical protein
VTAGLQAEMARCSVNFSTNNHALKNLFRLTENNLPEISKMVLQRMPLFYKTAEPITGNLA